MSPQLGRVAGPMVGLDEAVGCGPAAAIRGQSSHAVNREFCKPEPGRTPTLMRGIEVVSGLSGCDRHAGSAALCFNEPYNSRQRYLPSIIVLLLAPDAATER